MLGSVVGEGTLCARSPPHPAFSNRPPVAELGATRRRAAMSDAFRGVTWSSHQKRGSLWHVFWLR